VTIDGSGTRADHKVLASWLAGWLAGYSLNKLGWPKLQSILLENVSVYSIVVHSETVFQE